MIKDLARLLALGPLAHTEAFVHRWAFARPADDADAGSAESAVLFDEARAIGIGGDWAAGGRVEGAFLSGVALAGRLLGQPAGGFDRSTMLVTG